MTNLADLRAVWPLVVPKYERLYWTSPFFKTAIDQLFDHIFPALTRGARVTRDDVEAERLALDAAAAMVDGFAEQAAEMDRRHEALMLRVRSLPTVPRELFEDQPPRLTDVVTQEIAGRTVVRHPADC